MQWPRSPVRELASRVIRVQNGLMRVTAAARRFTNLGLAAALLAPTGAAGAQSDACAPVPDPGSAAEHRTRLRQLTGDAPTGGSLLRSSVAASTGSCPALALVPPELLFISNSALPYSQNDGALWAGRGTNVLVRAGVQARWGPLRLQLLPELVQSSNGAFALPPDTISHRQSPAFNRFAAPWFTRRVPPHGDTPWRFGDRPIARLRPGQSAVFVQVRNVASGISTANGWWGPGVHNALLLSNNAEGFPHVFLRPAKPVATRAGRFDARWLVGTIRESPYFDTVATNDLRSISMAAVTWEPPRPAGLTVGIARAVFAATGSWEEAVRGFTQVFADVGTPNARPYPYDATLTVGRDQVTSLFARWIFPAAGFEAYGEWGRSELPLSVRDFLVDPGHTQAYVLGLQWLGPALRTGGRIRAAAEVANLETGASWRYRPQGIWYLSRAAIQGYTNRGEVIGAAIGPGSSSQDVELGYVAPTWDLALTGRRVRWQNDAQVEHLNYFPSQGWCEHDVSMLAGVRGSATGRWGSVLVEATTGNRLNPFFTRQEACPGRNVGDVRNTTLRVQYSAARW